MLILQTSPMRAASVVPVRFGRALRGKKEPVRGPDLPMLVFFTKETSGPARRMESLLAHVQRKERDRLHVRRVDADEHPRLLKKFEVVQVPSLVLVIDKRIAARIDGRANMPQIERLLEAHLPLEEPVVLA
jgi:thioredoxin-like negative regulator of GroEL